MTKLTKEEEKKFTNLIKKIGDVRKGLPPHIFEALCNIVVFPACEIVLVNNRQEFLMTWREDKYWRGWHFPGGLLRFKEDFIQRLNKTAKVELGIKISSSKFLFPQNYNYGPRGHSVSLVYLCRSKQKPKDGKWFKTIPKNTILEHRNLWKDLKPILKELR